MEQLWAPWRLSYVANPKPKSREGDASAEPEPCFICQGLAANDDRANLIARRTEHSVVVLNRFPYNNGHLLVAPRRHLGQLQQLEPAEILDIQQTLTQMVTRLEKLMRAEGFNIGLNLGKVAGAGLPGHLHWHIVPRWFGDTNFMPTLADTKVIVQSLDALYDLLVP